MLGQSILLLAVAALCIAVRAESKSAVLRYIGLLCIGISAVCGIAGVAALGRNLTPFPKPDAKARLTLCGIYGVIRHPLYVCVALGAIGWSLFQNSWAAVGISLVLCVFLDAKARREERWLRQQFEDYAAYERKVRRFIPGIY